MRQTRLSHEFVEFIPEQLAEGVLYVSQRYKTAVHRCACGCKEEVVTPLGPTDWSFHLESGSATLHPSIGNWSFACRSHYFIQKGKVIWAGQMSRHLIERGREVDREARERYIEAANLEKSLPQQGHLYRAWIAFKRWFLS